MKGQDIKAGDIYRHFQGNLYQIVTVGKHVETLEEYIVYQALYGEFEIYIQKLQEFFAVLDKEKYPEIEQKYCFEKVEKEKLATEKNTGIFTIQNENTPIPDDIKKDTLHTDTFMEQNDDKDGMQMLMEFLDAETCKEKMEIFMKMRGKLDEKLLMNIAVSLDLVVDEKNIEDSCQIIIKNLEQRSKFECFRLR
ncbi:MAG: DUF1653 domain-containing protein [Lachnospiraceae bacterium]|nr:DUF1653 domain-containing protein [Lachnospiraceae bacterium]